MSIKCVLKIKDKIKKNFPEINLVDFSIPLDNGIPTPRLMDILEVDVNEKYYLKNEVVEKIIKESKFQERMVSFRKDK